MTEYFLPIFICVLIDDVCINCHIQANFVIRIEWNGLLLLILNIVMQTQLISDQNSPLCHINRRFNIRCDFPISYKTRKENKIMIIKSFSSNHNQSLCIKSLFRKDTQSTTSKNKAKSRLFKEEQKAEAEENEGRDAFLAKKDLNDCEKKLRHFRNLQKSDIFFKINEIQRKISRQIKNAKQRENKRYTTQTKSNKMKSKSNNNSINLNEIPAVIKIKHIQHNQAEATAKAAKLKTCTSFHHNRLISLINQRFLREADSKPISLSHLIKLNKSNNCVKRTEGEQFSGWHTESDYDF